MRPKGSPEELEGRPRRVTALLEQDLSLNEVARRLGCKANSLKRWRDAWRQGGDEALLP